MVFTNFETNVLITNILCVGIPLGMLVLDVNICKLEGPLELRPTNLDEDH